MATTHPREKLFDLMEDFETTVLVTRGRGSELRGRPMAVAEVSKTEGIWFASLSDSVLVDDLTHDPHVCLSMQSQTRFVSLSGIGTVHADRRKLDALWKDSWNAWFPQGKEDPKIRLIQVMPKAGDYWDMSGQSRWQVLWEMGEAYCHSRQPALQEPIHGHAELP